MELRHLESFRVLAEELHFGRAARRLCIAQPPLSRQIQDLERELGVLLFERTRRRVRLTPFGDYFRGEVGRVFDRISAAKSHLRLMKDGAAGEVRIGYVGAAMHSLLPAVLVEFRKRAPGVYTVLEELTGEAQVAALRDGAIDAGFLRTPLSAPDLRLVPVASEPFALIVASSHPLARSRTAPLAPLAGEPFIAFSRDCAPGMVDAITALCRREGVSPRVVHRTTQINSVVRLVESGLGWSIVPSGVRSAYRVRVKFFDLSDRPERTVLAAAFNPARIGPAAAILLEALERRASAG